MTPTDLAGFAWHCEPKRWSLDDGKLGLHPDPSTDFWQRTHYGFQVDNGHFFYREVSGDFVMSTCVDFHPVHQYDQAGVMVRVSANCWLKSSVEFEPSHPSRLGAVVTNDGYSDWSTQNFPKEITALWLRVRREADDYIVESSLDGGSWDQLRIAHLHAGRGLAVACGVYACSPKAAGFACEFTGVSVAPGRVGEAAAAG